MRRYVDKLIIHLSDGYDQPLASTLFVKGLNLFVILKLILLWRVFDVVWQYHAYTLPVSPITTVVLAPMMLIAHHSAILMTLAIALVLAILFIRPGYITNILFAWVCLNLYVINLPLGDGSDLVLLTMSAFAIPLTSRSSGDNVISVVVFNMARILCKWQLIFLYLSSGIDKLFSEVWRSGEAFNYIRHFEGRYNNFFPHFFQTTFWDIAFSWITILFELCFCILIWFRKTRPTMLTIAVVFHLAIWWMVTLPDFSLIMIIALLIFTEDSYWRRLTQKCRTVFK